jgi:hypothetical protein
MKVNFFLSVKASYSGVVTLQLPEQPCLHSIITSLSISLVFDCSYHMVQLAHLDCRLSESSVHCCYGTLILKFQIQVAISNLVQLAHDNPRISLSF